MDLVVLPLAIKLHAVINSMSHRCMDPSEYLIDEHFEELPCQSDNKDQAIPQGLRLNPQVLLVIT